LFLLQLGRRQLRKFARNERAAHQLGQQTDGDEAQQASSARQRILMVLRRRCDGKMQNCSSSSSA
jgi:hypothetical protein